MAKLRQTILTCFTNAVGERERGLWHNLVRSDEVGGALVILGFYKVDKRLLLHCELG